MRFEPAMNIWNLRKVWKEEAVGMKENIRLMHRKVIQNKTNIEILQFALLQMAALKLEKHLSSILFLWFTNI